MKKGVRQHELSMKGVLYFHYIMDGRKLFEGRVNGGKCRSMKPGDLLKMVDHEAGWGIVCKITSLDAYSGFRDMLADKGVLSMLPQLEEKSRTLSGEDLLLVGVDIYKAFPGSDKVNDYGSVAVGVEFLERV